MTTEMRDGSIVEDRRLGALFHHDPRSDNFPVAARLTTAQLRQPRSYTWAVGTHLDQGNEGTCVGHAVAHDLLARPVRVPNVDHSKAIEIFCIAQNLDPFPGDCSDGRRDGTSLTAGMEAARQLGFYREYRWAQGVDDALVALGYKGPGVLAIDWYEDMHYPDAAGWVIPTGQLVGRHAVLVFSISLKQECVWFWNNWTRGWGLEGKARLSFANFQTLLERPTGELAIPTSRLYGPLSE